MGLLFVAALVFAWPTYGLSVVAWFVLVILKSKNRIDQVIERENRTVFIEPLFGGRFSDFFQALDMPVLPGFQIDEAEAHQCGRHIMNYLAHNPEEGAIFLQGLKRWRAEAGYEICDPVTAADSERVYDEKGEIHLVSYRAVEALMTNNNSLQCFHPIDFGKIVHYRSMLELKTAVSSLKVHPA